VGQIATHPERILAGILFGNTLVNVASSSVMLAITRRLEDSLFGRDPVIASVILATTILLVVGEILPKGIAVHWPARVAPFLIPVLHPLLRIMTPVSRLLERVAVALLRTLGVRQETGPQELDRRELQLLFEEIQEGKEITEDEGLIASNIFTFFETRAYEIMTPRVDLIGLPVDIPSEEIRSRVVAARHSRLPVYRGSLDHVIGFIKAKELLIDSQVEMEAILHPAHFVPERARLHRILAEMQSRRLSLVVVVNEYGGTSGIITQEDLVEELVGEIFDEQERHLAPEVEEVGSGRWQVAGLLSLEDLAEVIGVDAPVGPAETVAGHVAHILGRIPRVGDEVRDGKVTFRVSQVRRQRAQRVEVAVGEDPR
jgi:CBS domain containing-hemolysin-like protein